MKDLFPPSSFTKTICNHWLVERLDPLSIVVLLKVEGKSCSHGSILHTFGESRPASTQSSSSRPSRLLKRGKRTVKTDVLKREKYLWKDDGEVDRGEITLGSARRVGSSRW
jgi:hypothetical protein